ncbi:MAG: rhomboid family intramembrane serine protease [Solirubrobacteraceae bacterium]|nr:rhomboid family intramembrane serine protease [Patulibacter sp.]
MTRPAEPASEYGATCYRHSGRGTNVRCQNSGKPICSECMRDTPVGYRCPDCAPTSKPIFDDSMVMTKVMLGICAAVFVVQVVLGLSHGQSNAILSATGDAAYTNPIYLHGALWAPGIDQDHEYWRIITSGFLHAGLIHIAFNSYFIWILGQLIEAAVGKLRFALLYLTSMIGGAAGALALSSVNTPTIGASGAAFGLLGAGIVMARLRRNEQLTNQLVITAVINFVITISLSGSISVGGHLGGFATGLVCGWIAYGPWQRQRWVAPVAYVGLAVVLFAVAVFIAHDKVQAFNDAQTVVGQVRTP